MICIFLKKKERNEKTRDLEPSNYPSFNDKDLGLEAKVSPKIKSLAIINAKIYQNLIYLKLEKEI